LIATGAAGTAACTRGGGSAAADCSLSFLARADRVARFARFESLGLGSGLAGSTGAATCAAGSGGVVSVASDGAAGAGAAATVTSDGAAGTAGGSWDAAGGSVEAASDGAGAGAGVGSGIEV